MRPRTRSASLVTALLLPVLLSSCGREVRTEAGAPTDAEIRGLAAAPGASAVGDAPGPAARTGMAAASSTTAILYSERDAELRARAEGRVVEILVELGDTVRAGQLLARIEDGEQRALLAMAEAAHELARAEHERVVPLAERRLIEAAELDRAVFRLQSTAAELELARARHAYTRIRAPFGGVVSRRFIRVAETVAPADPLFRVTATTPLRVRVAVPEADALRIEVGRRVLLEGAAGTATARVLRIAPAIDPAAGTREILLDVDRPGALPPGAAVRLDWTTPDREPDGRLPADRAGP